MVCGVALCAMLKRRVGGKGIRGRDCIASVVRMVGVGVGEARPVLAIFSFLSSLSFFLGCANTCVPLAHHFSIPRRCAVYL